MMPIDLPWDIITDILSRLPVKYLTRFKCISTSFYNLISNDPLLKQQHLYHHQSNLKVLVCDELDTTRESSTKTCCVFLVSPSRDDVHEETTDLEFPIRIGMPLHGLIYNSCDGLFCIGVNGTDDVIIWNPSTRQAKRLPRCGHPGYTKYSLAHESRSNVYKILGNFDNHISLRFYSTETEIWRCVEDRPPCFKVRYSVEPTIVNGAFHWLCCHNYSYYGDSSDDEDEIIFRPHVVSLDICYETFGMLAMPKSFCETEVPPRLGVLKGKLCVMCDIDSQTRWEIWVMIEYGVADSMTRMFSFSRDELRTRSCCPLYTLENIDIFMIYDNSIGKLFCKDTRVLCDQFDGDIKTNRVPYAFVESLISPHTSLEKVSSNNEIVVANLFFRNDDS